MLAIPAEKEQRSLRKHFMNQIILNYKDTMYLSICAGKLKKNFWRYLEEKKITIFIDCC